jgi:hypothetical protein
MRYCVICDYPKDQCECLPIEFGKTTIEELKEIKRKAKTKKNVPAH